jgi:hypothetical protein
MWLICIRGHVIVKSDAENVPITLVLKLFEWDTLAVGIHVVLEKLSLDQNLRVRSKLDTNLQPLESNIHLFVGQRLHI